MGNQFVLEVWKTFEAFVPANKKVDIAYSFLSACEDHGIEYDSTICEEEPTLSESYNLLYDLDEDEEIDYLD